PGKKNYAEGVQKITTVHATPLDQGSTGVTQWSRAMWRDRWFSELSTYIPVMVLVGCALLYAIFANGVQMRDMHLKIFLMVIIILTMAWLLFFKAYTCRQKVAVTRKDMHAGPVWLRGGLVLFAFGSLIMVGLRMTYYVCCVPCDLAVNISFSVVKAVFILMQTLFLWFHARDCVHVQRSLTRCGLMLTLATNLMLWITAVTEESLHQIVNLDITTHYSYRTLLLRAAVAGEDCQSDKAGHFPCTKLELAFYYLYPFYIEYCMFALAMAFVMWRNVGRIVDDHRPHRHHFRLRYALPGGLVLLVVGLSAFMTYEKDMAAEDQEKRDKALSVFYIISILVIALMTLASVIGCTVYWLEPREHVSGKNPTLSLDVTLEKIASKGEMAISILSIVAVFGMGMDSYVSSLNLAWSMLTVVQVVVQNIFIIEGLWRKPYDDLPGESNFSSHFPLHALKKGGYNQIFAAPSTSTIIPVHQPLSMKRIMLKEISAFLLLSNILLWILPAFGVRPHFDNPIGKEFYSFQNWVTVVNVGLPFAIFYRMHSASSLFEVHLTS
ncbi:hypothetical protein NFI96_026740, partial [Prochilodus magdalenae]